MSPSCNGTQVPAIQLGNIQECTYKNCNEETRKDFENWVRGMTQEPDGETGDGPEGAYAWVQAQNATFGEDGVYETFIFVDQVSGRVVATGSVIPDDRDVGKDHGIAGSGFWGFVNTRVEYRGQGIGKFVCAFIDRHIQAHVNRTGQSATFSLFTANPVAVGIYVALGFEFVRQIYVSAFQSTEDLYTKTYSPSASR